MKTKQIITASLISGLFMGIVLFIGGAVFSRIIYGPQFAPPGKFEPEQLNAFYFIWTKVLIGIFFSCLFTFFYQSLPVKNRIDSGIRGLKYGFFLWFVMSLWNISHPLIYGSFSTKNEIFWLLYSLTGFLALGFSLGRFYKKYGVKNL